MQGVVGCGQFFARLVVGQSGFLELFGSEAEVAGLGEKVRVKSVQTGVANIAGIPIPTFESVEFEEIPWDIFDTDWFVDDAIRAMRDAVSLKEAYKVLEEQHRLLSAELRTTSQRVNLFEKVKIPECRENIRRIRIMLGDLDTSAVARSKIAKRKAEEAAAS